MKRKGKAWGLGVAAAIIAGAVVSPRAAGSVVVDLITGAGNNRTISGATCLFDRPAGLALMGLISQNRRRQAA